MKKTNSKHSNTTKRLPKILLYCLVMATNATVAFSAQASVNVLTGAFEKDWQDLVGGSKRSPQRVLRSYSSREGWSFQFEQIKPSQIKRNAAGQVIQVGRWKYFYKNGLLISATDGSRIEIYDYDPFGNMTFIKASEGSTHIQYDSDKDRVLSVIDQCELHVSYNELIAKARYQLITQLVSRCSRTPASSLSRQYRFQFRPTLDGWELEQVWESSQKGELP